MESPRHWRKHRRPRLAAQGRPNLPSMLSHAAYVTSDTVATTEFFTEVLGMELVNAVLDDAIPSTG